MSLLPVNSLLVCLGVFGVVLSSTASEAAVGDKIFTAGDTGDSCFLRALNRSDGKPLWSTRVGKKGGGGTAIIVTPIVHDGHVFVANGYKVGSILLRITAAGGKFNAEEVYADRSKAASHGGVLRLGDRVYFGGLCMEMKTGKPARGWGGGAITFADGRIYSLEQQGRVTLHEPTPTAKKDQGHFDLPDRSKDPAWAHPVVAGGRLYLRDQDVLLCYDVTAK